MTKLVNNSKLLITLSMLTTKSIIKNNHLLLLSINTNLKASTY